MRQGTPIVYRGSPYLHWIVVLKPPVDEANGRRAVAWLSTDTPTSYWLAWRLSPHMTSMRPRDWIKIVRSIAHFGGATLLQVEAQV